MNPDPKRKMLPSERITIPILQHPGFRAEIAKQNGVHRNILIHNWGGLGDEICAEPTLRYALKTLKKCDVYLSTDRPELFRHLKFKEVFDLKEVVAKKLAIDESKFFIMKTIVNQVDTELSFFFFAHLMTNCVDYCSIHALRGQLPVADREVILVPSKEDSVGDARLATGCGKPFIVVHPGKHWPTKTFPKDWWDAVLLCIRSAGVVPVIIGADVDLANGDNRGTVDVDTTGCIDLRNRLSTMETVWLLQNSRVLLTNDSAPLHMAVTGDAWVGFIATCKHPDYITHWRKGQWAWRMENLGKGGIWDIYDYNPNAENAIQVDNVDEKTLRSWLPSPKEFASWGVERARQ